MVYDNPKPENIGINDQYFKFNIFNDSGNVVYKIITNKVIFDDSDNDGKYYNIEFNNK